jgi:microcystin-dependent protein
MSNPFIAEIRVVGFNFAPSGWAFCDGALMPIAQNTALFSLLGTTYGGDGRSTFALPDFRGRAGVGVGQGSLQGFTDYLQGETGGVETIALDQTEIPLHTHAAQAVPFPADQTSPSAARSLARSKPANAYQSDASASNIVQMAPEALTPAGGSLPHNNVQPVLVLNFIIALQGVFPPRP